eukprot:TRINITY_DN14299_c0_g1_i1.p1 TRINITY_DN14299_c0_g1~~TRINITY_DN14299_c0_g1_i1.p1  ORF type:complete len:127 (-),score=27.85 TRINITY_DN14299_c0_g1_i1:300-680(-)
MDKAQYKMQQRPPLSSFRALRQVCGKTNVNVLLTVDASSPQTYCEHFRALEPDSAARFCNPELSLCFVSAEEDSKQVAVMLFDIPLTNQALELLEEYDQRSTEMEGTRKIWLIDPLKPPPARRGQR